MSDENNVVDYKPILVGSRVSLVRCEDKNEATTLCDGLRYGAVGILREISPEKDRALVQWGKGVNGHSGGSKYADRTCWWLWLTELELVTGEESHDE